MSGRFSNEWYKTKRVRVEEEGEGANIQNRPLDSGAASSVASQQGEEDIGRSRWKKKKKKKKKKKEEMKKEKREESNVGEKWQLKSAKISFAYRSFLMTSLLLFRWLEKQLFQGAL